jgi:uncharacterized UBP type Zn finger protein
MPERCEHFADIRAVEPRAAGCEECLAIGSKWTELRVCLTCGHVGCCEDSQHAHAAQHFKSTGHPIIVPLDPESGSDWSWCYAHRRYYDPAPEAPRRKKRSGLAALLGRIVGR